jgi:two-component system nitrogen regulation response regulator GlnG
MFARSMGEKRLTNKKVFIVIADGGRREALMLAYGAADFEVSSAPDMATARPLASQSFDLILADASLPDGEGVELLARASQTPVFFVCDQQAERLRLSSAGAAGFLRPGQPLPQLAAAATDLPDDLGITGSSPITQALRTRIRLLAQSDGRALITGATGVGKELVIKAIHALSQRRAGPLVVVNAAAVPGGLIDSELFGHSEGAFTDAVADRVGRFVEADGGILVLDQVADLPLAQQARLLRVLETGTVTPIGGSPQAIDVRIIATTHEALEPLVERGDFRADLFHRLAVHLVEVPSLVQRLDDLAELVAAIAPSFAGDELLLRRLRREAWPGNIRQLAHFLERLHLLRRPGEPLAELLEQELGRRPGLSGRAGPWLRMPLAELVRQRVAASLPVDEDLPEDLYHEVLSEIERGLFALVLERVGGKQLRAAKHLGINRNTLHKKLKALGMLRG